MDKTGKHKKAKTEKTYFFQSLFAKIGKHKNRKQKYGKYSILFANAKPANIKPASNAVLLLFFIYKRIDNTDRRNPERAYIAL